MKPLGAHVLDGRIVLDEPTDLPEGAAVQVVVLPDEHDELSAAELAELDAALRDGAAQISRGERVDARAFVSTLFAKS